MEDSIAIEQLSNRDALRAKFFLPCVVRLRNHLRHAMWFAVRTSGLPASRPDAAVSKQGRPSPDELDRSPSYTTTLLLILLIGFIVRLLVWQFFQGSELYIGDAKDYDRFAVGLAESGRYLTPSGELSSLRPPLYPWLVSLSYRVFGVQNYEAVRLAQALLNLLNVVIVYGIGSRVFSPRVAIVAAALFCFYPSTLGFNNLLLSETLFTFLVSLSLWLFAVSIDRRSLLWLLPVGIVLGLGSLTRSILWLSTPFVGLLLLVAWPDKLGKRCAAATLLLAAFSVTIAPWAYRNTKIQKTFTLIDVMGGRNVMMGNYEHTPLDRSWATISLVRGDRSWLKVLIKERGKVAGLTQGQIDKLAMRRGIHFMLSHPGLTAKRSVVRFFNFWQLDRTLVAGLWLGYWSDNLSDGAFVLIATIVMGYYAVLAYLGIVGTFFANPRDRLMHYLLLLNIALPCLVHSAIFAHSRYHLAVMPCVIIYSAYAIVSMPKIAARQPRKRLALAIIACGVLSLGWIREIIMVDLAVMATQV